MFAPNERRVSKRQWLFRLFYRTATSTQNPATAESGSSSPVVRLGLPVGSRACHHDTGGIENFTAGGAGTLRRAGPRLARIGIDRVVRIVSRLDTDDVSLLHVGIDPVVGRDETDGT